MQVKDVMSARVRTINLTATLQDAATLMAEIDVGALPVADNERLVGMITDRDIAVRGIALGLGPDASVRDAMSADVKYCFEDQDVDAVCQNMADIQVRRLPVVDRDKNLVGIVSLADMAGNGETEAAGAAIEGISRRGGLHNQSVELNA